MVKVGLEREIGYVIKGKDGKDISDDDLNGKFDHLLLFHRGTALVNL